MPTELSELQLPDSPFWEVGVDLWPHNPVKQSLAICSYGHLKVAGASSLFKIKKKTLIICIGEGGYGYPCRCRRRPEVLASMELELQAIWGR